MNSQSTVFTMELSKISGDASRRYSILRAIHLRRNEQDHQRHLRTLYSRKFRTHVSKRWLSRHVGLPSNLVKLIPMKETCGSGCPDPILGHREFLFSRLRFSGPILV